MDDKRYIELNGLINDLNRFAPEKFNALINNIIRNQSTADVQEVRHVEWEKQQNGKVVCSECGREVVYQVIDGRWEYENYCPHCGAKMDNEYAKRRG